MKVLADASLTAEQFQRITNGLPCLSELSETILVPYPVYRLENCTVVWINYRWFAERGFYLQDPIERRAIERWMIESFGYVSNPPNELSKQGGGDTIFHADRYGSNNSLFAHGGSGRGAAVGHFHVKGVGPTPLVGKGVNREHSHGNASLNVALREAIYSEIVANEFPAGAVPVIGILDAGIPFESSSTPGKMLRRAIIVRPGMLRPAHLQRAAGFIEPADGHRNSQIEDAARARDLVRHVVFPEAKSPLKRIQRFFRSVAQQIAFGQVHRIYSGGYFSSNLTLDGELLDFGNTYVFPDWCNAKVLDNDMGFGRELDTVAITAHSLAFHLKKYAEIKISESIADEMLSLARSMHEERFEIEALRVWGLSHSDADAERALGFTRRMYETNQRVSVNYSFGKSSNLLGLHLNEQVDEHAVSAATEVVVKEMLREMGCEEHASASYRRMRISAQRYLRYRRSCDRGWLQRESERLIASLPKEGMGEAVSTFVNDCVGRSRRHWPMLPINLLVVAQVSELDSAALYCVDETSRPVIWLEGSVLGGVLKVFGRSIELCHVAGVTTQATRAGFASAVAASKGGARIKFLDFDVPSPTVVYDVTEFEKFCDGWLP